MPDRLTHLRRLAEASAKWPGHEEEAQTLAWAVRVAQERDRLRVECEIWRDKIDSEWKKLDLADSWANRSMRPSTSIAMLVLRGLGIFACDECGGVGCEFCNGHGWLMAEDDYADNQDGGA